MVFCEAVKETVRLEGPGIFLKSRQMSLFRRGVPEMTLEELPRASHLGAGDAAPLLDRRGRVVGAGVADPDRGVLRIWSHRPVRALDERFFLTKVDSALALRSPLIREQETNAYRIIHGPGDGLSGISVDAWGEFLVLEAYGCGPARWAGAIEKALVQRIRPRGIIEKLVLEKLESSGSSLISKSRHSAPPRERGKVREKVAHGESPPETLVVTENGIPFSVRLLGARHEGLFTDMREERRRLGQLAASRRVLNGFAYTGSFSVAAVRGGALETTSVDIVGKVLEWAKENFRLSGIDPGRHHFARMDMQEYLKLARKRRWTFDVVILDPPTFATTKDSRWSLHRDYPALIQSALSVLAPRGYLWVCANAAGASSKEVDQWIAAGSSRARRTLRVVVRAGQPIDYPAPAGFPRYHYLKVRVLQG